MEQTTDNRSYDKKFMAYIKNIDLFAPTDTACSNNRKEKPSTPQTSVQPKKLELLLEN